MGKYADKLAKIEQAIEDVVSMGQHVRDDGFVYERANLASLRMIADRYRSLARKEKRPRSRSYSLAPK